MLYYDISYHLNGILYFRLTDPNDYAGKDLKPSSVYTEISLKDSQRPTNEVVLLMDNVNDEIRREAEGFISEFNERHQTKYNYKMRARMRFS